MRLAMILLLSAAAGAEAKEPRWADHSTETVRQIADCITLRLTDVRGYEVTKQPIQNGEEIRLRYRVAGVAATAATFVVRDSGNERVVTAFATGRSNGAPRQAAEKARQCVSEKAM